MKVQLVAAVALSGVAVASSQPARGYLFRQNQPDGRSSSIPRQVARLLVQQRLGADEQSSLKELAGLPNQDATLDDLNRLGNPTGLFDDDSVYNPSQLVILIEGVDSKKMEDSISNSRPVFEVADPPCSSAHRSLVQEVALSGVRENKCELSRAINPLDSDCWGDSHASISRFDAQKDPSILQSLDSISAKLVRLAKNGELETLIFLIPEASRNAKPKSWSSQVQDLRRRQAETVISADDDKKAASSPQPTSPAKSPVSPLLRKKKAKIPACFQSLDACISNTGNCSGHGYCANKWAPRDDDDDNRKRDNDKKACFACRCLKESTKGTTHWAGATCEKIDMSVPVALFVGFTILIVIFLAGAITMLFQVGEEPLPGVLGAGVTKK